MYNSNDMTSWKSMGAKKNGTEVLVNDDHLTLTNRWSYFLLFLQQSHYFVVSHC